MTRFAAEARGRLSPTSVAKKRASTQAGYNLLVEEHPVPLFNRESAVDDKLRLRMPLDFQWALGTERTWFVTSLDGATVHLYRPADWKRLKGSLQHQGAAGDAITLFAEENGIEYQMDSNGRILLPPQLPLSRQLRNKTVCVSWQGDHLLVRATSRYAEEPLK